MKRFLTYILCLMVSLSIVAQKPASRKSTRKKTTTTRVDKKTQLRNEKVEAEKARKRSQEQAARLMKNIKSNLDSVLILDHQVKRQKQSIDSLSTEITSLSSQINSLTKELHKLGRQLEIKQQRYAKAAVMMRRQRSMQQRLMFIFSADNFAQLVRRIRYTNEYTQYQQAQGELLKEKQQEVNAKQNELLDAKARLQTCLGTMERKQQSLVDLKSNCEKKATFLNKNLATVQKQVTEYQRKIESIDQQIERIIQAEIEAARRAEEARKKTEAEARERARRQAEQRAARGGKPASGKGRSASSSSSSSTSSSSSGSTKPEVWKTSSEDVKLSSNFAANKGRLPIPITGSYAVTGHYGNYQVSGLRSVTLNNKGIDIRGQQGASACSVFDGVVSTVFEYGGQFIVMVRHGEYISVYSGLRSVSVSQGQKVSTRATLGSVGTDSDGRTVLHFQLRHLTTRLNPEQWVR